MEAGKGIQSSGWLQNDRDSPEGTAKGKNDMRVGKGIEPANNCVPVQNDSENKRYSSVKPILGLNRKN